MKKYDSYGWYQYPLEVLISVPPVKTRALVKPYATLFPAVAPFCHSYRNNAASVLKIVTDWVQKPYHQVRFNLAHCLTVEFPLKEYRACVISMCDWNKHKTLLNFVWRVNNAERLAESIHQSQYNTEYFYFNQVGHIMSNCQLNTAEPFYLVLHTLKNNICR